MTSSAVEIWVEKALGKTLPVANVTERRAPALVTFGIDRSTLGQQGLDKCQQERLYRLLFVYSKGFHDALGSLTKSSNIASVQTAMNCWQAFVRLVEFCEPKITNMITREMKRAHNEHINVLQQTQQLRDVRTEEQFDTLKRQINITNLEAISYKEQLEQQKLSSNAVMGSLEARVKYADVEIEQLSTTKITLEDQVETLDSRLQVKTELVEYLEEKIAKLEEKVLMLTDANALLKDKNMRLTAKVDAYESQKSNDTADRDDLRAQLATHLADRQALYRRNVELDASLKAAEASIVQLQANVEQLQRELTDTQCQLKHSQRECEQWQRAYEDVCETMENVYQAFPEGSLKTPFDKLTLNTLKHSDSIHCCCECSLSIITMSYICSMGLVLIHKDIILISQLIIRRTN